MLQSLNEPHAYARKGVPIVPSGKAMSSEGSGAWKALALKLTLHLSILYSLLKPMKNIRVRLLLMLFLS